jgi:hypothetical protein
MRCLVCGHNMLLIAASPAEAGFVHGSRSRGFNVPPVAKSSKGLCLSPRLLLHAPEWRRPPLPLIA